MCQITPFSLPCCRRVYVLAKKISTCPDEWPKLKCAPELCLQIGTHLLTSAEHKTEGTCWRCKAHWEGITSEERERLRPAIDRAELVEGLEETTPEERRKRVEATGKCWFCMGDASKRGCDMCGVKAQTPQFSSTLMGPPPPRSKPRIGNGKRNQLVTKTPNKRRKMESSYSGSSMGSRSNGTRHANIASHFQAPNEIKTDAFVDSTWQLQPQNIVHQSQHDGITSMNTQKRSSPRESYEICSGILDRTFNANQDTHYSPTYSLPQPQGNSNTPSSYLQIPYQSRDRNLANTRSPTHGVYQSGSMFNTPSGNILNPQVFQSRRPILNPPSQIDPPSSFFEQTQSQSVNQVNSREVDISSSQWNIANFGPGSTYQPPHSESQTYPRVRDFATTPASSYVIDPQLLSSQHSPESHSLYCSTPASTNFKFQPEVELESPTCHETGDQRPQFQISTSGSEPGASDGRDEACFTNVDAGGDSTSKTRAHSDITQSKSYLQAVELQRDSASWDLLSDSKLGLILDESYDSPSHL